MLRVKVLFSLVIVFIVHSNIFGQTVVDLKSIIPPPYQANSSNFMMVSFFLNENDVNAFLPEKVRAKVNKEKMVPAIFEMYETNKIYGIPNYKVAFIVVDVEGFDSENGTPGHFAIWGNINSEKASKNFRYHFGLPFAFNNSISINVSKNTQTGIINLDKESQLVFKITKDYNKPLDETGIVNMIGKTIDGGIVKSEVPWLSKGYYGTEIEFEIQNPKHSVLKLLKNIKPVFSLISEEQIFSYSKPINVK